MKTFREIMFKYDSYDGGDSFRIDDIEKAVEEYASQKPDAQGLNKSIWKFQLEVEDIQLVEMPVNAEILTLQVQNGRPCIWALVNPDEEKIKIGIEIYGTGHTIPEANRRYIGTFQLKGRLLGYHCFQLISII